MDDWKKRKRTSGANKTRWSNEWEICVEGNYSPANEKGPFHETPKTQRVGALAWGRRSFSSAFGIFSSPENRNFPFVFFYSPWTQEHPRDRGRQAGRRTDSTRPLRRIIGKTNRSEQCGAGWQDKICSWGLQSKMWGFWKKLRMKCTDHWVSAGRGYVSNKTSSVG